MIYIFLTKVTTDFGTPAVAALGVGHKLELLNYFVCAGMGAAATTLVGQNLGAGNPSRAARATWRTLFLTCLPVGAVTLVLVSFPDQAVAVFNADPEVVSAGTTYVLIACLSQLFMAFEVVCLSAFAGAQWTAVPAAVEMGLTAARVPVAMCSGRPRSRGRRSVDRHRRHHRPQGFATRNHVPRAARAGEMRFTPQG